MIDWPVGLSTGCFYNRSIFDCLEPIRNAGFGMIEICSFPKHLDYNDTAAVKEAHEMIDRLGLEPYSMHAPFRDEIDITSPDESRRSYAVGEVGRAVDSASVLGVKYLVIHPGPERGDIPRSERLQRMDYAADSINQIARRCREKNVGLVLENMLPHLFTGPVRELLWILGSMAARDVGICLDTGHAALSGDLYGVVHKLSGHLWMVHASDNHGRFDDHLPPGQGKIDWDRLLTQLAKIRFHGALILETSGAKLPTDVLDEAQEARKLLRGIGRRLE
jgi:sugar phosphate isomerase/epimerase